MTRIQRLFVFGCVVAFVAGACTPKPRPAPVPPITEPTPAEESLLETRRSLADLHFDRALQSAEEGLKTLGTADDETTRRELKFAVGLAWHLRAKDLEERGAPPTEQQAALARAEEAYRRLLETEERDAPSTLANLADVVANRGNTEEAVRLLEQAVRVDNLNDAAYDYRIGKLLSVGSEWRQAAEHLQKSALADVGNLEPVSELLELWSTHNPLLAADFARAAAADAAAPFAVEAVLRILADSRVAAAHDGAAVALAQALARQFIFDDDRSKVATRIAAAVDQHPGRLELVWLLAQPATDANAYVWWRSLADDGKRIAAFRELAMVVGDAETRRGDVENARRYLVLAEGFSRFLPAASAALISFEGGLRELVKVDETISRRHVESTTAPHDRGLYDYHYAAGFTYAAESRWDNVQRPEHGARYHLEKVLSLSQELGIPLEHRFVDNLNQARRYATTAAGVTQVFGGLAEEAEAFATLASGITLDVVHFNVGQSAVTPKIASALDLLVADVRERTNTITLHGHASADGSDHLNWRLSEERAANVKAYLVDHGINEHRITTDAFGDTRPARSNRTIEGRRYNRRVVFRTE